MRGNFGQCQAGTGGLRWYWQNFVDSFQHYQKARPPWKANKRRYTR